ncbi:hypothetical protein WN55_10283 [Dufourea novaeangliae]|uniref:Uncharacterized protein n=1 Tax=Dufourea novaeangliae TaxID=178035 RepID=A0A154P3G7_DUFNO|nr:hypothetical protein WN55_10283 [Dufourea novaeangliae]
MYVPCRCSKNDFRGVISQAFEARLAASITLPKDKMFLSRSRLFGHRRAAVVQNIVHSSRGRRSINENLSWHERFFISLLEWPTTLERVNALPPPLCLLSGCS